MKVGFYNCQPDEDTKCAPAYKSIENLKKKNSTAWLYSFVKQTLDDVRKNCTDLKKYEESNIVKRLKNCKEPIFEFRIPKTDRRGVARLYFCYVEHESEQVIVILTSEVKTTKRADTKKIREAEKRYREEYK